jgi:hypothetical protein
MIDLILIQSNHGRHPEIERAVELCHDNLYDQQIPLYCSLTTGGQGKERVLTPAARAVQVVTRHWLAPCRFRRPSTGRCCKDLSRHQVLGNGA